MQLLRTVNPYGFVSIQRFYIYAEQGLSRQRVAGWIYEGQLRIAYRETLIARYRCAYDQRQKRLREVSHPMLYLKFCKVCRTQGETSTAGRQQKQATI